MEWSCTVRYLPTDTDIETIQRYPCAVPLTAQECKRQVVVRRPISPSVRVQWHAGVCLAVASVAFVRERYGVGCCRREDGWMRVFRGCRRLVTRVARQMGRKRETRLGLCISGFWSLCAADVGRVERDGEMRQELQEHGRWSRGGRVEIADGQRKEAAQSFVLSESA